MTKRREFLCLGGILIIAALLSSGTLTNGHDWGDDFASYIMQARSIVDGNMQDFVKHNRFTIENSSFFIGPVAYPWGYPLMLAPTYRLMGLSLYGFKTLNIVFFLLFLISFYLLVSRNRLPPLEALLLTAILAFNPQLLTFQDNILSDIPFLFLSTLSIGLIDLVLSRPERESNALMGGVIGLAIFGAYFVRTNGITLLLTFLISRVLSFWRTQRSRPSANRFHSILIPAATFVFLALAASHVFPSGQSSYFTPFKGFSLAVLKENLFYYLRIGAIFFSSIPGNNIVYGIFFTFFIVGIITAPINDLFLTLYFFLTLFAFVLWPQQQGLRFIFPILPIFIYFAHRGMKMVATSIRHNATLQEWLPKAPWIPILLLFCCTSMANDIDNLNRGRRTGGPFDRYSLDLYRFLKEKTPENSVIIFFKPRVLRMMTGHDAIMVNQCEKLDLGNYIVVDLSVDPEPGEFAEQLPLTGLKTCGIPLNPVFRNEEFSVFEIQKLQLSVF